MSWRTGEISQLLEDSAGIALSLKGRLETATKPDQSIVTSADREIERRLAEALERPGEGVFLIGEETVFRKDPAHLRRALTEEAYIVDPIDGTAPYAHGLPHWGISVGRMVGGRLTDGAVLLPELGGLTITSGDEVLEADFSGGRIGELRPLVPRMLPVGGQSLIAVSQVIAKGGAIPKTNPVQALATAVVPLMGVARGQFLAYIGDVKFWDIAGSIPILLRAGLEVRLRDSLAPLGDRVSAEAYVLEEGSPRRWRLRESIIVSTAAGVEYCRDIQLGVD